MRDLYLISFKLNVSLFLSLLLSGLSHMGGGNKNGGRNIQFTVLWKADPASTIYYLVWDFLHFLIIKDQT